MIGIMLRRTTNLFNGGIIEFWRENKREKARAGMRFVHGFLPSRLLHSR